jgi:hypothetical protein
MEKGKKPKKDKREKPHGLPDAELAAKYDNGVSVDFSNVIRTIVKTPKAPK